ncbi:MAG: hypothetical protein JNL10_16885 [Verrucomicrobiales bacterium]|nr:hypothetical protein [Verrucomicrobiales bacterium]
MNSDAMLTWLATLGTAALGAVVGALAVGFLANLCVGWYRISSFEGGSGYYVLFMGLFGAFAGFVIGAICSRVAVQGTDAHFLRGAALTLAWTCGLTLCAGVLARIAADVPPESNGRSYEVEVELRFPPGVKPPPPQERFSPSATLMREGTSRSGGHANFEVSKAVESEGRWVLASVMTLKTAAARKTVYVSLEEQHGMYFPIGLGSRPKESDFQWSSWYDVESIYRKTEWTRPPAGTSFSLRYRVRVHTPPPPAPPQPTAAELEAEAFAALSPGAPFRDWLKFLRNGFPQDRIEPVVRNFSGRPDGNHELAALMVDPDTPTASEALRFVSLLPNPDPAVIAALSAAGRDLAARLEKTIALTPEQDPSYEAAADISLRFSPWMLSTRILHERQGTDFSTELRALLVLARKRPDSIVLRGDVVRVASYYLNQWTGEAPHPDDPPPR